jgi:type VI protein secretion system component VasK
MGVWYTGAAQEAHVAIWSFVVVVLVAALVAFGWYLTPASRSRFANSVVVFLALVGLALVWGYGVPASLRERERQLAKRSAAVDAKQAKVDQHSDAVLAAVTARLEAITEIEQRMERRAAERGTSGDPE